MKKQAGFTIVELVVVIALLGILAAVALPRFLNVTDDAHTAAVSGTGGAFKSGVSLVKAQAVVESTFDNNLTFDGQTIRVNADGYPQGAATVTGDGCVNVWNVVLQGGPSVGTSAGDYIAAATAADGDCVYSYQASKDSSGTAYYSITYTPETGEVVLDTTK